jgi:exopolysaccharide production protein ExoZ
MTDTARIHSIQYLRGIAALAVALAHIASLQRGLAPNTPLVIPEFVGFWGVDIFFVISGFIIVHITRDASPSSQQAVLFMVKRLVRIVPCYWFFTALMYFADTQHWFSEQPTKTNIAMLLKSMFFIKPGFPLLFVGWTLTLEMFFYSVYAVALFFLSHKGRIFSVGLFLLLLTALPFIFDSKQRYFVFYTQAILLEFVAGMLLAACYKTSREMLSHSVGLALLVAGSLLLVAGLIFVNTEVLIRQRALWWGVPAVLIVAGAIHISLKKYCVTLFRMGTISYSLYLCHIPCAYLSFVITKKYFYFLDTPSLAYLFMAVGLTVLVSVLSWQLFENFPQKVLHKFVV